MSGTDDVVTVLGAFVDALRQRSGAPVARLLAEDVVWQGVQPELRCDGRQQAMEILGHRFTTGSLVVDAVEAVAGPAGVMVALRGPGLGVVHGDAGPSGHVYTVARLRDGRVVELHSYADRAVALAAAGAADPTLDAGPAQGPDPAADPGAGPAVAPA